MDSMGILLSVFCSMTVLNTFLLIFLFETTKNPEIKINSRNSKHADWYSCRIEKEKQSKDLADNRLEDEYWGRQEADWIAKYGEIPVVSDIPDEKQKGE